METGFNIVEVPGSQSRKVAGKKQHWYRTAILKNSASLQNTRRINLLNPYSPADYYFLKILYGIGQSDQYGLILKQKSFYSFKLQKTARIIFSRSTDVLVKPGFVCADCTDKTDFTAADIRTGRESNTLKKQI